VLLQAKIFCGRGVFTEEYPFDTVLMAVNPVADRFDKAVLVARNKGMGIIGMKVMSRGILPQYFSVPRLLKYALKRSDVAIIGCSSETDLEKSIEGACKLPRPQGPGL
jgi:hypothetical protein